MLSRYNFVVVEGNTGAGKTSLAQMLASDYNATLLLEEFEDNPFLPKFYYEPHKYAFHTEIHFMLDRQQQIKRWLDDFYAHNKGLTIADYLPIKSLLYSEINLEKDEYMLFHRLFHSLFEQLPQPELVIYIHSTVPRLLRNIEKRGRNFEKASRAHYLQTVENTYFRYFRHNPQLRVIVIHADNMDYVENPNHYGLIRQWLQQDYPIGISEVRL